MRDYQYKSSNFNLKIKQVVLIYKIYFSKLELRLIYFRIISYSFSFFWGRGGVVNEGAVGYAGRREEGGKRYNWSI